ncbi:MAG: phosphotransferase system enzyme component [Gemmatimonadetes bacterium]|nr:phosphotransferase system enzyme component [Gemmatimonadota bacterium]
MSEFVKRAVVAGHAEFAAGLVSAVEQITGRGEALVAVQVRDLCGEDIQKLLRDTLRETGACVIFTDLQAGSCTMAARRVLRDLERGVLVAGVNLPMLLDFALSNNPDATEAARAAAEKGRASVSVHGVPA